MAACLASIFEINIDDIPDMNENSWWSTLQNWLRPLGYAAINLEIKEEEKLNSLPNIPRNVFFIAAGISPRGLNHAVVAEGGVIIHDPHPDGGGIDHIKEITLIMPLSYVSGN